MMKPYTDRLHLAVSHADTRCAMLSGARGILVGYSGGADSAALLHILHGECEKRGLFLAAVHVHHGIRGAEADRDAAFCEAECARLGVEFHLRRADIPAMAKESGRGLEETARDFRYRTFAEILASDARLSCIATAHHAGDNAETVLMHLMRGTGIDGLCGIPPVREADGVRIIRPLIFVPKADVLGYCRENGVNYISDSTNEDTNYTRNYIRNVLLPGMIERNPSLFDAIGRMTESLREDSALLDAEAERLAASISDGCTIDARGLADAPKALAIRAAAKVYARISAHTLETVHLRAIVGMAESRRTRATVNLPDGILAVKTGERIRFTRETDTPLPPFEMALHEGINKPRGRNFVLLVRKSDAPYADFQKDKEYLKNIYKLSIHTQVNSDRIKSVLYARSRRPGDAYVFGGMTRKLKKLYNDRGYDAKTRWGLPVLADGEGILWVPGFPPADRVTDGYGSALDIEYYYND